MRRWNEGCWWIEHLFDHFLGSSLEEKIRRNLKKNCIKYEYMISLPVQINHNQIEFVVPGIFALCIYVSNLVNIIFHLIKVNVSFHIPLAILRHFKQFCIVHGLQSFEMYETHSPNSNEFIFHIRKRAKAKKKMWISFTCHILNVHKCFFRLLECLWQKGTHLLSRRLLVMKIKFCKTIKPKIWEYV